VASLLDISQYVQHHSTIFKAVAAKHEVGRVSMAAGDFAMFDANLCQKLQRLPFSKYPGACSNKDPIKEAIEFSEQDSVFPAFEANVLTVCSMHT